MKNTTSLRAVWREASPSERVLVLGAFGALAFGHIAVSRGEPAGTAEQAQAVADAYADVSHCMTGRADAAEYQETVEALRDVRLALAGDALAKGEAATTRIGLGPDRWPGRCEPFARSLEEAALADPAHTAVAYYAVQLSHALRPGAPANEPIEWTAAAYGEFLNLTAVVRDAKGLPAARPPQGSAPPSVQPQLGSALVPMRFATLEQVETNGSRPLRYLFAVDGARTVCTFTDELTRRATGVTCSKLPAGGHRFASSSSDSDGFAWSSDGVLTASGAELLSGRLTTAAAITDDGSAIALVEDKADHLLRRRGPDGKLSERKLSLGCAEGWWKPLFLGNELLWHCFGDKVHVVSIDETLHDEPRVLDDTPDPASSETPFQCQLAGGHALVIQGGESGERRAPGKIMFRSASGWNKARDLTAPVERVRCDVDSVSIIGFEEVEPFEYELVYERCTPDQCDAKRVALRTLIRSSDMMPAERSDFDVADLGGALALVWKANALGVRLRVAPFDGLGTGPDRVVYADPNGVFPLGLRMDARGDAAVVTLNLPDGRAFGRVARTGEVIELSPAAEQPR